MYVCVYYLCMQCMHASMYVLVHAKASMFVKTYVQFLTKLHAFK